VTRAPAAVGKPNCDDKFRPGVYRVGTFDQRRDAAARRKGTAQRALTAAPDPFSSSSTRKGSAEPIQKEENRAAARFLKPSAGLEPATPSVPWRSGWAAEAASEAKALHRLANVAPHTPAAERTVRPLRLPTGTQAPGAVLEDGPLDGRHIEAGIVEDRPRHDRRARRWRRHVLATASGLPLGLVRSRRGRLGSFGPLAACRFVQNTAGRTPTATSRTSFIGTEESHSSSEGRSNRSSRAAGGRSVSGDDEGPLRLRPQGVLNRRQRLRLSRSALRRSPRGPLAQPGPRPPPHPCELAQPGGDLLHDPPAQGPNPQRLRRPRCAARTLNEFERHWNEVAEPFEWNFTPDDLAKLIDRLAAHEPQLRLAA
jgi:hypothetical protein